MRVRWITSGGDSACSLNAGIALLHRAEQILVPLDRQIGIVAALQQQLHAAERDRLVDLAEDLLEAEHVALARSDRPVERAEVAARHADVRVVDVAVDDVGDDAVGMLARADAVGELAEQRQRRVVIQLERLGGAHAARRRLNARRRVCLRSFVASSEPQRSARTSDQVRARAA